MRGSDQDQDGPRRVRPAPLCTRLALMLLIALSASCGSGGDADSDGDPDIRAGQITRPANAGLPLDNPRAVQAYARAEQLLIDWFFRRNFDAALSSFSSDLHPAYQPLLEDTNVNGDCHFIQVAGSQPDAEGTVLARYEIRDCQITPPDAPEASHIKLIITITDQNAWITGVEFE